MTNRTLARARARDEDAFRELTDPYRRELQLHCYRIVGSTQDAEDLVQETLLAAWRGLDQFNERASIRTWLYRIATNRSIDALRASARRPRSLDPMTEPPEPTRVTEPIWLEPYPDVLLDGLADGAPGPATRYEHKEATALAFVAGLQHLPPQQRAVLVLRDVLSFRAAEVAEMLDASEAAVNSLLRRARSTIESRLPAAGRERAPLPNSRREREMVGRFAEAVESGDVDRVLALLTDDAWVTMPPQPYEYQGAEAIGRFLRDRAVNRGHRCGWSRPAPTDNPPSAVTSPAPTRTSRVRTDCSYSHSPAMASRRSPFSPTAACSLTSGSPARYPNSEHDRRA